MTKHLIVGLGEVGLALKNIFKADGEDKFKNISAPLKEYKFLHITFPFRDESFIDEVKAYQEKYKPKFTIIHSTVPIGTSEKLDAVHSPVRGVHPHLEEGILTFKKFIGGRYAFEVSEEFRRFRLHTMCTLYSRNTEALKLLDTTQYGFMILINKMIYKWCEENGIDFNIAYTLGNETYNDGYRALFRDEVVRPFLKYYDEPLKGHCVLENAILLRDLDFDNEMIDRVLRMGKHIESIPEKKPYLNRAWFYCELANKKTIKQIAEEQGISEEELQTIVKNNGWKTTL